MFGCQQIGRKYFRLHKKFPVLDIELLTNRVHIIFQMIQPIGVESPISFGTPNTLIEQFHLPLSLY